MPPFLPIELGAVSVALIGAFAYGTGDFLGGRAALRLSPSGAVTVAQCAALIITILGFLDGARILPDAEVVVWGMVGGSAYALGLLKLYQGIALGRIGVVAPICGVVGILVPLGGDITLGRAITGNELVGIAICGLAIVLLAGTPEKQNGPRPGHFSFRLGLVSGMGYGTADLCLGIMEPEDGSSALMVARGVAAAIALGLLVMALLRSGGFGSDAEPRAPVPLKVAWIRPPHLKAMVPAALLAGTAGILDAIGHMSYVHVATQGSMAVASALVALFPAVVVLLAVVVLRERIIGLQHVGLGASVLGIVTISL